MESTFCHRGTPYQVVPVLTDYSGYPAHRVSESHFHNVYHVVPVLAGEGWLEREQDRLRLAPGVVAVIDPGDKHIFLTDAVPLHIFAFNFYLIPSGVSTETGYAPGAAALERAALRVPFSELAGSVHWTRSSVSMDPGLERWGRLVEEVRRFREDIRAYTDYPGPQRPGHLARWYRDRCAGFLQSAVCVLSRPEWPSPAAALGGERVLRETDRAVREQLEHKLDLRALARRVQRSPAYLSELFHARSGMTLTRYHSSLRIARACELLRDHGQPIARIALSLGYSSPQHFCAAFRRERHMSPREYRGMGGAG